METDPIIAPLGVQFQTFEYFFCRFSKLVVEAITVRVSPVVTHALCVGSPSRDAGLHLVKSRPAHMLPSLCDSASTSPSVALFPESV